MQQWFLGSGETVTDRNPSHVHTGVTPELLTEAFGRITDNVGEKKIKATLNLGRCIGVCTRVETHADDTIIFAQRVHRGGLSRFVKNRQPEPTTLITVSIHRTADGNYKIGTAYLGGPGHVEPWAATPNRRQDAVTFWSKHALCFGYEPIIPDTEQNACPW